MKHGFCFVSAQESTQLEARAFLWSLRSRSTEACVPWLSKWLNHTPESPAEQAKLLVQSDIQGDACIAPTQSSTSVINVN